MCADARTHMDAHTIENTFFKEVFEVIQTWVMMAEIQRYGRLCGVRYALPSHTLWLHRLDSHWPAGFSEWSSVETAMLFHFLKYFTAALEPQQQSWVITTKLCSPQSCEILGSLRKSGSPILVLISVSGNAYCFLRSGVHLQLYIELPFFLCVSPSYVIQISSEVS